MTFFGQKNVSITECDNGWIVEWSIPYDDHDRDISRRMGMREKTEGKEVFTKRKDMLAFVARKL